MNGRTFLAAGAAVLVATGGLGGAALAQDAAGTTVKVTLGKPSELGLTAPAKGKAGSITFVVTNRGMIAHEMVVVPLPAGVTKLAAKNGRASEKGRLGEAPEMGSGRTKSFTVTVEPGKYVLVCNVRGHFQGGMFTNFTVA